jgi:hypothetical protein
MHKQGAVEISNRENISLTQSQKHQKFKDNDPKQITTRQF